MTTHPIQYQAPLFRALAASSALDIRVLFARIPDPQEQAAGFGGAFEWDLPLRDGYDFEVLPQVDLGHWLPEYWRRPARRLRRAIANFKPDALLVMGWQEVSLLQGWLAGVLRQVPVILRGDSTLRPGHRGLYRRLAELWLRSAHRFLVVGQRNRYWYLAHGISAERLLLAPHFVDNQRFTATAAALEPSRAALRAHWSIPEQALCLLFAGKLEPKKRPLDLLAALAQARDHGAAVHGLIVGEGALKHECAEFARRAELPLTFAGFLNQSEISRAYVACDALVLPSDAGESWGLVVNEAMACGRPVLVSDAVGCAPDLVRPGQTGEQFALGDVQQLAAIIARWSGQRAQLAVMGAAARELVCEQFSIAHTVAVIEQLLHGLPSAPLVRR